MNKEKKIIFWGAGKNGRLALSIWKQYGKKPDYFVDNNTEQQYKYIDGISILSPKEVINDKDNGIVVITAGYDSNGIRKQLIGMGYKDEGIFFATNIHLIYHTWFALFDDTALTDDIETSRNVLFDFSNGMVLGGVESWSIETAGYMLKLGVKAYFLTHIVEANYKNQMDVIHIDFSREISPKTMQKDVDLILHLSPCTIICNFPDYISVLAVAAKIKAPHKIKIVSVQHNDEANYYLTYLMGRKYIHKYLYISKCMAEKMEILGFPKNKMIFLPWVIEGKERNMRVYNNNAGPIKIGYAGRIVKEQKRLNLFRDIVDELENRKIKYELSFAGEGDYLEELKALLIGENIHFYGTVTRNQIPDFWSEQDIMISCSEWEGHSISQCEAMAEGVVPLLTDVSGVRDDVTDGENGFIVSGRIVEEIVDHIEYLSKNRKILIEMGKKASETIRQKYQKRNVLALWKNVLNIS